MNWAYILVFGVGLVFGSLIVMTNLELIEHTEEMKLYWVEYSIGGGPYLYCDKFNYSGEGNLFDCETKSIGNHLTYAGIELDNNAISENGLMCLEKCLKFPS